MPPTSRRNFVGTAVSTGLTTAPAIRSLWGQQSPNQRVNVGVVGFRGRGRDHYRAFARMPNVRVAYLCDIDERLYPEAVAEVEKFGREQARDLSGHPQDARAEGPGRNNRGDARPLAPATIWACQAGKDVYCEKPISHNLSEGRKMVQAARKYNRIVQAGLNRRSEMRNRAGVDFVRKASFGQAYRAKAVVYRGRVGVGTVQESSIPQGVHWDLFLGPAPYAPFTLNRFHYGWHYFWDTATSEVGNNGVHAMDIVRWAMAKDVHPVKIHCVGGFYADRGDQQTPNVQNASYE